ncbi:hypothetical protein DYI95_011305 [Thermaerobacter sp. PB12/4term]|uniref:hypothetical protein n=1 Tax=Thermaerobacter sp. PB12/4term TaxID=2293838 RepID=UPI000E329F2A|nr:hypothetical protein [Thermaerobacter sp. PB12/4term]QIA28016.1 hypothetical protein DYI95_011305 [Thermaerobacter sp. PB12/4term]
MMADRQASPRPAVPWEPGDRWLLPAAGLRPPGGGPVPPRPGVRLVPDRYTITYLSDLDELDGDELRRPEGGPAGRYPAPRVLVTPVPAPAVAPLWGTVLQGVTARDPEHLQALLEVAGRWPGTRWVLLPWDALTAPPLWARAWARVTAWAPAAAGPVIMPAGLQGDHQVPSRLAAELARVRRELLRNLEEPVPAPVVLPANLAGFGPQERAGAGLAGVPVWWLLS